MRPKAMHRRPTARISGPAGLVQAVPYLLGFHPTDSVVLIGLDGPTLIVTARIDLADLAAPRGDDLLTSVLAALADGGVREVIGVLYETAPGPGAPIRLPTLSRTVGRAADRVGCVLDDLLVVADGRWWSCREVGEPAARGHRTPGCPVPDTPSAFVAEATVAGVVPLAGRAELAGTLEPVPEPQRERLRPLLEAGTDGREPTASARREPLGAARLADRPGWVFALDEATTARVAVTLRSRPVRDQLWIAIDRGRLDGRPLWRELARRLPTPHDAAPLFLYGWASWRAGNSTLAGMACERALVSDPEYSAAEMLLEVVGHGVDPRRVPPLRSPTRGTATVV